MTNPKLIPPVIKWSGSKRPIAYAISKLMPSTSRFFDPFVGGGAILPYRPAKPAYAGDVVKELIDLWQLIQREPALVADGYELRWQARQDRGHEVYYQVRERFNAQRDPVDFLFLSRSCVNGLIRFNKSGDFNNSLHHTRPGIDPRRLRQIIWAWHSALQGIQFCSADYRETLSGVTAGDVVFLDPPYVGTKGRYLPTTFSFEEFYAQLERLNSLSAYWVLMLDGTAGDRTYSDKVPTDLYKTRLSLPTGKSPFTRLMGTSIDQVNESVYLNFEPSAEYFPGPIQYWQKPMEFARA